MLWIFLSVLCFKGINAGFKGSSITCVCSTVHCIENREQRCNTTGMCFSQYLDRQDGNHPIVRGCITSQTPLLCENRKPAIATGSSWPVLFCCSSNLCNRDVVPTPPPWLNKDGVGNDSLHRHADRFDADIPEIQFKKDVTLNNNSETPSHSLSSDVPSSIHNPFKSISSTSSSSSAFPHIMSPVYISVLVLGIVSLVIIGIVAAMVLRRSNRFYMEQYGALDLEYQHEQACMKHGRTSYPPPAHVQTECDSDEESLSQCSQMYVHVINTNRPANNT